jgi:hypothetical protein
MDTARVQTYGSVAAIPHLSKRFALKRYLGLTQEEMTENEKLWKEENVDEDTHLPANAELRTVGITANGIGSDLDSLSGATDAVPPGMEEPDATGVPGGAQQPGASNTPAV